MKRILCFVSLLFCLAPAFAQTYEVENISGEFVKSIKPIKGMERRGANAMCIEGNILYCGAGKTVYCVDVSEPLNPKPLSSVDIYGLVRQLAVQDGYLYASCRESGAWVFDVHDPNNIKVLKRFDTVELATGIEVCGNVLFLGTRQNGVECVDISNPADPVHIRMEKTHESQSVTYRDGLLYSGEWGAHCITVIDAHDMGELKTLRTVNLQGHGDGVWTWGKYLYAATGHHLSTPDMPYKEREGRGHGLEIFDISVPDKPAFVGRVGFDKCYVRSNDCWTPRPCSDGNYVVVADTFNGFYIVDTHNPADPQIISRLQFKDWKDRKAAATSLAIGEGVVYISVSGGCGFYVLECPDAHPCVKEKGTPPTNAEYRYPYQTSKASHFRAWKPEKYSPVRGLAARKDILYVAHSYGGLSILRKSKKDFEVIGTGPMAYAGDVKVVGDILWVAEGPDGLAAYKIGKGADLTFIARYNDFFKQGPNACCVWVFAPTDKIIGANMRFGNYYLDVSNLPEIKFKAYFEGGVGWDKYYADKADSKGWYPETRHRDAIYWVNLNSEKIERVRDDGLVPSLADGVCLFRDDKFLTCSNRQIFIYSSSEIGDPKYGEGKGFSGMPVWDGGKKLGLTHRLGKKISLVDYPDGYDPIVLWQENTEGYPETGIFWGGKFCVPCGYQGLLIEK